MNETLLMVIGVTGVVSLAISGCLLAENSSIDGFGVIVLGVLTALGGGTLRDLYLDLTAFWVAEVFYLYATSIGILAAIIVSRFKLKINRQIILTFDAIGLAALNVVGLVEAARVGVDLTICITMGVVSAIFGGLIRDVICQDKPLVMKGQVYTLSVIMGGMAFGVALNFGYSENLAGIVAFITCLTLRLMAMWRGWTPTFMGKNI